MGTQAHIQDLNLPPIMAAFLFLPDVKIAMPPLVLFIISMVHRLLFLAHISGIYIDQSLGKRSVSLASHHSSCACNQLIMCPRPPKFTKNIVNRIRRLGSSMQT
jgi:hypothetical protein